MTHVANKALTASFSLTKTASDAFIADTVDEKLYLIERLALALKSDKGTDDGKTLGWADALRMPAYPKGLALVSPRQVGRRRLGTARGRAELIHAIAHIEWHAIHLAIDAALRFEVMPKRFMLDWLGVAVEEAGHFSMLNQHLQMHYQVSYGDFPAHAGMWDMARKTELDVVARMALVPRVLEARGLDVTPEMILGLMRHGDPEGASCLALILKEEVRHVWLGTYWYRYACTLRGVDPEAHFFDLLKKFHTPRTHVSMNILARQLAGFSQLELDQLSLLGQDRSTPNNERHGESNCGPNGALNFAPDGEANSLSQA